MPGGRPGENSDHGIQPKEVKGYTLNLTEDLDSDPEKLKIYASDLNRLQSRMLGRSHDLDGAHKDAAQSFTELFKWPITEESSGDLEHWFDTTRAIFICAALTEELADAVEYYKDERARIISRWNTEAPYTLDIETPIDQVTPDNPVDNVTHDITDNSGLIKLKDELEEEERILKETSVETIEEIADNIRDGEAPDVLARLYEGGYINYGYFNMGGDLNEGIPFDINHEELPENMMEYVDGDKDPDDDFYEMVAFLGTLGFKAAGAQNHDDVEMTPEDMELLKNLFDHIEEEGDLMGIPDEVQGSFSPEDSAALLGALGGGLLALSDQRLSGRNEPTPSGYYALPESFREAAEHEFQGRAGEDPWSALHGFFQNVPEGLSPGRGLSLTLNMSIADYLESASEEGDYSSHQGNLSLHDQPFHDENIEEQISEILEVSFRNEGANAEMLGGFEDETGFQHYSVDPENANEAREEALAALFTHDWRDDGETLSGLTSWIPEYASSDNPEVQRETAEVMQSFMDTITSKEMHEKLSGIDAGDLEENKIDEAKLSPAFTVVNPEFADSLADLYGVYVRSFASDDGFNGGMDLEWTPEGSIWDERSGTFQSNPGDRLVFLEYLVAEQKSAEKVVATTEAFMHTALDTHIGGGDSTLAARDAARLQGFVDNAFELEEETRGSEIESNREDKEKIYERLAGMGGDVVGMIPHVGTALSWGLDYASTEAIDSMFDDFVVVDPKGSTYTDDITPQNYARISVLEQVMESTGGEISGFHPTSDTGVDENLRRLEETGVIKRGERVRYTDVEKEELETGEYALPSDYVFEFVEDSSEWNSKVTSEEANQALGVILDPHEVDWGEDNPETGGGAQINGREALSFANEFSTDFVAAYSAFKDLSPAEGNTIEDLRNRRK